MSGHTILVAGTATQIVGLLVTALGLLRTWRAFSPEGEGLWDPAISTARSAWRWATARFGRIFRWLFRRPKHVQVHAGGASLGVGFGVKARGRKQFRELPASVPLQEALEELDQRTRELMEGVNDVRDALEDEVEKRQATEAQLRTDLDSAVQRLDEQDRRVAVGGIRLEALGVFLVALGLVLALVGSVVP